MRNNQLKYDLFWVGKLLGKDVYLMCSGEKEAERAERILQKIITDADLKAGNINL